MKAKYIQWAITSVAIGVALVHIFFPRVAIDAITVTLILAAFVPWLAPLFKKIKLPGGLELEYANQEASDSAPQATPSAKEAINELPPDSFLPVSSIRTIVEKSQLLEPGEFIVNDLLLYQTPAQHTWLVATNRQMFVVLDDAGTRRSTRLIQTALPLDEVLPIKTTTEDGAGIVRFRGQDVWWYYGHDLFPTAKSLKDSLGTLLKPSGS